MIEPSPLLLFDALPRQLGPDPSECLHEPELSVVAGGLEGNY